MQEVISMVKKSTRIYVMKYVLNDSLNCVANEKKKTQKHYREVDSTSKTEEQ